MHISSDRDAKRRKQILEATIKSIQIHGLNNVTLQGIAKVAGLSKGGILHYYASKNQLFLASFSYFFEGIVIECQQNCERYESQLDKLLACDIIFQLANPQIKMTHYIFHDFMALAVHDTLYQKIFDEWVESWITLLSKILNDGIADGSFDIIDVNGTARAISAVLHGIGTRCFLAPQSHPSDWAVSSFHEIAKKLTGTTDC